MFVSSVWSCSLRSIAWYSVTHGLCRSPVGGNVLFCLRRFNCNFDDVFRFLLLARYIPNVAERSVWEQCIILRTDWPTTDRPTDDLAFCKISNGHISATGHPIHFIFVLVQDFRGRRIEWTYFRLHQIQDGGWPPSWKISNGQIWNELSDPLSWITEQLGRIAYRRK